MENDKKVAIVTGSATGVGAATCKQLALAGWNVVINYTKSEKEAREVVSECKDLGADALLCRGDVSNDNDCKLIVQETLKRWNRIDGLANNAGTTKFCDFSDLDGLDGEDFVKMYQVNVIGAYQMTRAARPALKESGGSIVNTSSIAGLSGMGSSIAYCASKGALNTLTLSLAQALGPEIRVNAVCPGFIETRWTKDFLGERYEEVRQQFEDASALKLTSQPEDTADAIVYFLTSARVATGQLLIMDGGSTLGQVTLGRG